MSTGSTPQADARGGPQSDHRGARLMLGVGLPATAALVFFLPYLAVAGDIPDRLATHFDVSGVPDDSMTVATFMLVSAGLAGIGVVVCGVLALSRRTWAPGVLPMAGFIGGFLAMLGAGLVAMTVLTQRGLSVWQDAEISWLGLAGLFLLALTGGGVAARTAAGLPQRADDVSAGAVPVMDLESGQRAVWTTTLHSRPVMFVGVALTLATVPFVVSGLWIPATPLFLAALGVLALVSLRISVDDRGLVVRYGILPWPKTIIAVDRVKSASVIDVRPREWGGWGYRGSLKLLNQAAVVHRAGPGIKVDLVDGKVFVVTTDQPAVGAGLLNAHVRRARAAA